MRVVFAGPSIWGINYDHLRGVDLRPPAQRGDILRALHEGAEAIAIIDGLFGNCPSIGHKEILFALSRRVPVIGGASMGALRAAECHVFGMIGIGGIYRDYADGTLVSDSDVAVLHAPAEFNFKPMTSALVDIEATLTKVRRTIGIDTCELVLNAAKVLHFSERSWDKIVEFAGLNCELSVKLLHHTVERKQTDAIETLKALRCNIPQKTAPNFNATESFMVDIEQYSPDLANS